MVSGLHSILLAEWKHFIKCLHASVSDSCTSYPLLRNNTWLFTLQRMKWGLGGGFRGFSLGLFFMSIYTFLSNCIQRVLLFHRIIAHSLANGIMYCSKQMLLSLFWNCQQTSVAFKIVFSSKNLLTLFVIIALFPNAWLKILITIQKESSYCGFWPRKTLHFFQLCFYFRQSGVGIMWWHLVGL